MAHSARSSTINHYTFTARLRLAVLTMLLLTGSAMMLFPLYVMLVSSFVETRSLYFGDLKLLPQTWSLEPLFFIWSRGGFADNFLNSAVVATAVSVITVLTSAYAGFALTQYRVPCRQWIIRLLLLVTIFPGSVLLVPRFMTILELQWLNSYEALIAPFAVDMLGIFMMYQVMQNFPRQLIETAHVDGIPSHRIFLQIVLPLLSGPCTVLGLFTFVQEWGRLLWPSVAANHTQMHTLAVALSSMTSGDENLYTHNPFSAALISTVPLIVLYLLLRRQLFAGMLQYHSHR